MQSSAKVVIARTVAIIGCFISVETLLRAAHVLPQREAASIAYAAYPSLLQHFLVIFATVIDLVASIFLLKLWRISAALFTFRFVELLLLATYRAYIAPSGQILAFASHHNQTPYFVAAQALSAAFVVYAWWVTAQSGWFESNPDWNAINKAKEA